ncbi:integrase [Opitutaceae bacterium TAV5]|nr:integrase [Opitutaceae bacterium TAV5]
MALELRKNSKWWYGRVQVDGQVLCKNLGVQIHGTVPNSLREQGDILFERSRIKAMVALEKWQEETKKQGTAEELVQTLHELRTGARIHSLPLGDIFKTWKELPRRRKPSERYVDQAGRWMERFVAFLSEKQPAVRAMAQVQSEMARAFLRQEEARGISPKTYNNELIFLRSCFQALRKAGGLTENPFEGIPTKEEDTIFRKPFDEAELAAIVETAKGDEFIYPIIVTGICTAMRRGDCCLLQWSAVDLPNRFIQVKSSKTGELVQIPLFPLLQNVLSKRTQGKDKGYVFPEQAKMYQNNPDGITHRVRRILKRAGFSDPEEGDGETEQDKTKSLGALHQSREKGLRKASVRDFHSFRVTWVTLALTASVPLEIVQKVTGHRTAGIVTKHYFQPGRDAFRQTLSEKLPAILGGSSNPSGPKSLSLDEIKEKVRAMTPKTWKAIREELLATWGLKKRKGQSSTTQSATAAAKVTA